MEKSKCIYCVKINEEINQRINECSKLVHVKNKTEKKRICHQVDFADPVNHSERIKSEKMDKYLDLVWKQKL